MLELSQPMKFVMLRAAAEASALKAAGIRVEFVLLGLLKLVEVPTDKLAPRERVQAVGEEIRLVNCLLDTALRRQGLETGAARSLLRRLLRQEPETSRASGGDIVAKLLARAGAAAAKDGLSEIPAHLVLSLIMVQPPPLAAALFAEKPEDNAAGRDPKAKPDKKAAKDKPPMPGREFLPELTGRIRRMRCSLLQKIFGQDHAVHTFAEGVFNSEVLAHADEERRRPRAIFVFAGPPGVGKTFLAEQAAAALEIPFKRFDMSGFSDHQQHLDLVGFAPSYKDAKEGVLTGFVRENPHCILLFDEIEKAHLNTIHLFLQILDAGILQDKFSEKDVPFKDCLIIFTTNAGRQLYEGDAKGGGGAGLARKTILDALETDIHPQTGNPFFPAAICSRLATGWPVMFNHLQAQDLENISAGEFGRCAELFHKQYGIRVEADDFLRTALLFAEGGQADARTLRAQTEIFFKSELFKLCRLFNLEGFEKAVKGLECIRFQVEAEILPTDVRPLFHDPRKPEILLFGAGATLATRCRDAMPAYVWHDADNEAAAFGILAKNDVRLALIIPTMCTPAVLSSGGGGTMTAFDFVPMGASGLQAVRSFFRNLRARLPELPVYLLEPAGAQIDEELQMSFVRAGARGKLALPEDDFSVFEEELARISRRLYLQQAAADLAARRLVLSFDTAPLPDAAGRQMTIRLRDLALKRAVAAADAGELVDEAEKPKVRFADVIGATAAKDELKFFIDYLKDPKRFAALGLRPPKGVLLHGPPGTGKTLLAKAMAGEADVAFIPAVASAFVTKWQGSGPEAVRELFQRARRYAPAIVFIDEIDAIGRARGGGNSGHGEEMALNALLTEMDGFSVDPKRPVFVLAATNFQVEEGRGGMGLIDQALARRFDRKILVDLPDKTARRRYLEVKLEARPGAAVTPEMLDRLAGRSTGMSLANLENVIELAARTAAKHGSPITDALLEEAFETSRHGEEKKWDPEFLERIARHEAGHAFMYWRAGHTPAYLTIVARGGHGGYMEHADDEAGAPLKTRDELLANMRTTLGGRAAELVFYGEDKGVSTGAGGDLESATRIARAMICNYGMDEEIGLAVLSDKDAGGAAFAARIHERASAMIRTELQAAVEIIEAERPRLEALIRALLEKNRLTGDEIRQTLEKA